MVTQDVARLDGIVVTGVESMTRTVSILMLLLVALPAHTQSDTHPKDITQSGKMFLDGCSSIDKPPNQLNSYETHSNVQCLSYVDGIFESMSLFDNLHSEPHVFCAPERPVQRKELVEIVRKYITDNPKTRNERTVVLGWLAFSQAFSCNKSKT